MTYPRTIESAATTSSSNTEAEGYVVPVDPMDALGCDSCE